MPNQNEFDPGPDRDRALEKPEEQFPDVFDDDDTRRITAPEPERRSRRRRGQEEEEAFQIEPRDYLPIRGRRTGRTGCMGGIMYAVFVICISVILACGGWMAACDILALNKEAKAVGLKRGDPLFQVPKLIAEHHVTVIDVHHRLYREVSHRIMESVKRTEMVLEFVQYSVDEFFGEILSF